VAWNGVVRRTNVMPWLASRNTGSQDICSATWRRYPCTPCSSPVMSHAWLFPTTTRDGPSLPTCYCHAQVRERDWANVITCHQGSPAAYTWRLQNFTLGEHVLRPPPDDALPPAAAGQDAAVTAVGMSPCGNFGLVGTAAGRVDRYNMQSGLHRGVFCRRSSSSSAAGEGRGP
jgi:hypothetical protein